MKKETKSKQKNSMCYVLFLKFAAKSFKYQVMKLKLGLIFCMMLVPICMFSTSVTCLGYYWQTKGRTLSPTSVNLVEKNGNVVLSSRGTIQDAEIVITNVDGTVLKLYSYSSVDSPLEVLSEGEIPQEGCYVKISQGAKYVLYHVTKD